MKVIKEVNATKHIFDTTKIGKGDAIVIRDSEQRMLQFKYSEIYSEFKANNLKLGGIKIICLVHDVKDQTIVVIDANCNLLHFYAEEFIEELDLEILAKQQIYHK